MSATDTDSNSTVWSIRGVPNALIEDVKAAARRDNKTIGQLVAQSLRTFFDEYAKQSETASGINYVDAKLAAAEERLAAQITAEIEARFETQDRDDTSPRDISPAP